MTQDEEIVIMQVRRFIQIFLIAMLTIGFVPMATAAQGNNEVAHACQKGGWQYLKRSEDNTRFRNQGDCVSYGAQGGMLAPITPALSVEFAYANYTVGSFNWCLPIITLSDFVPNSTYTVQHNVIGDQNNYTSSVKTDATGSISFTPWSYRDHNQMIVNVDGMTTGNVPIACAP